MVDLSLEITLRSDTTFGRGDGIAGVVDQEVEHDASTGLPIIKGRTLKGLLVEECANILYSLEIASSVALRDMQQTADRLFGIPGSDLGGQSILHIGTAVLPRELADQIRYDISQKKLTPREVLDALTTIRRQTAVNPELDTPKENSLRAQRVILRETVFHAPITALESLTSHDEELLAACAASLRRAGHSRNRGRGWIQVLVVGLPDTALTYFALRVRGGR